MESNDPINNKFNLRENKTSSSELNTFGESVCSSTNAKC